MAIDIESMLAAAAPHVNAVWDDSFDVLVVSPHNCRYPNQQILLPSKAVIFKKGSFLGKQPVKVKAGTLQFSLEAFADKKADGESQGFICNVKDVAEAPDVALEGSLKAIILMNHHNRYVGFKNTTSSFISITRMQTLNEAPRACEIQQFLCSSRGSLRRIDTKSNRRAISTSIWKGM
jgi:hypothetical protein